MIPKIIHYCWFGKNPIPEEYLKYINTWKEKCPNCEIKKWDETNFDVYENRYCKEAYEAKKWAFVSDYARLKIIYEYGGIYLDTDVELLKDITELIVDGIGYIGFQNSWEVATGLGFAAPAHNKCIKAMLDMYDNTCFLLKDRKYNLIACPARNTVGLMKCGLKIGKDMNGIVQELQEMNVYPVDFFNPLNLDTNELKITNNTYSIHRYTASWYTEKAKRMKKIKRILPRRILEYRVSKIVKKNMKLIQNEMKVI